jgi:hypothetical protein
MMWTGNFGCSKQGLPATGLLEGHAAALVAAASALLLTARLLVCLAATAEPR